MSDARRPTIAVVLACHNRADLTLTAVRAVADQELGDNVATHIYVLDDASTDATAERLRALPDITILSGDGSLFWNGGMRRAWQAAMADGHDFYLWLNDDTILDDDAMRRLLATHRQQVRTGECIVVGATRHPDHGHVTYGGTTRRSRIRPLRFDVLAPSSAPLRAQSMNGNCVLIPDTIARRVGNLEPRYRHAMGDFDYGLRARAAGYNIWVCPGTIGTCRDHDAPSSGVGEGSLADAWSLIVSIKGLPPRDWATFARRWGGPLWPVYWISPYVRRGIAALTDRAAASTGPAGHAARASRTKVKR